MSDPAGAVLGKLLSVTPSRSLPLGAGYQPVHFKLVGLNCPLYETLRILGLYFWSPILPVWSSVACHVTASHRGLHFFGEAKL